MALHSRPSGYWRGRQSLAVVQETRGTLYPFLCLAGAVVLFLYGVRNIFFCSYVLEVEKDALAMFEGCETDTWKKLYMGMNGMFMWVHAMLKVLAVTAENTADLYNSIFVAVFIDCGYIFFSARSLSVLPGLYVALAVFQTSIDSYILYIAWKARSARLRGDKKE